MKNIRTFQQYTAVYESTDSDLITVALMQLATPFVCYGLFRGYEKVSELFDKLDFEIAKSTIGPLFAKIQDDPKIKDLLMELEKHKNNLYFGEEEGRNIEREEAFEIRNEFYKRAKQLMSEKDYKKFIEACNEFEDGVNEPAGYFLNKDAKYTRYRKYGRKPNRIRLEDE